MNLYMIQIGRNDYLTGQDEDGRTFLPFYGSYEDAEEAALRSDLDNYRIVRIVLDEHTAPDQETGG